MIHSKLCVIFTQNYTLIFNNTNFLVNFTRFSIFDYKEFKRQAWWRSGYACYDS